jgi:hypothetical protein
MPPPPKPPSRLPSLPKHYEPWEWKSWFVSDCRWRLMGDWPAGASVIPVGSELVGELNVRGELMEVVGPFGPCPTPLPVNAYCLDQTAADFMSLWHRERLHLLHGAPGVVFRAGSALDTALALRRL